MTVPSVLAIGDLMLDVLVHSESGLVGDDDIEAEIRLVPGGQAANVTSWVVHLGGRATLLAPRHDDVIGHLLDADRRARGVALAGTPGPGRSGSVVSFSGGGTRTLASDRGDRDWARCLREAGDLGAHDWVLVSGYALLRMPQPAPLVGVVDGLRGHGAQIALDLAAATLLSAYARDLPRALTELAPDLVLGTTAEWAALETALALEPGAGPRAFPSAVVKDGAGDVQVHEAGDMSSHPVRTPGADVVDTTGAGDSFTAGFLLGGIGLALRAADECIREHGAAPPLA